MSEQKKSAHKEDDFADIALAQSEERGENNSHKLNDNIAKLESDLNAERDARGEERWYWISVCSLLIDPLIFNSVNHTGVFGLIFAVQIVILIALANKFGVDWAVRLLALLFYKLIGQTDNKLK